MMRSRAISAITVILCVVALAVEGSALEQAKPKEADLVSKPEIHTEKYTPPRGPCGWFAPENCEPPEGCVAARTGVINRVSTDERYADLLGEPTGDYAEVDAFVAKMGYVSDELAADLERLSAASIPVDIEFEQGKAVLGL